MSARALVVPLLLITACPMPMPVPDAGMLPAPVLTSVSPTSGPTTGGTSVTLNGANFISGATVTFGAATATATVDSDKRIIAVAPAATTGSIAVTVTNPDGRTSTLPNAYTYVTPVVRVINEAILQNPAQRSATTPATTLSEQIIAHVQVNGVTPGNGKGAGLKAQVGFATTVSATPVATDFSWNDAAYLGDVDGSASGDKARDSYGGMVTLPASATPQPYVLAARFSIDDGQTWTLADRDGAANGVTTAQLSVVTVTRGSIEWCKLGGEVVEAPPSVSLRGAAAGPVVYGQVYQATVTSMVGAGAGIKGALGYGAAGSDPATWTWVPATFNTDTGGGMNDEFQATLPNPGVGTYKYAFRFNRDDGPWSYCDADGLTTGAFTEAQAGTLTVQGVTIDSCKVQFPDTLTSYEGRPSDLVYGRVFIQGFTEAVGAAPGVEGQVGYGAANSLPDDTTWTWSATATYNREDQGGGDEQQASIVGPVPGVYGYAYRFRVAGGPWTYCDRDSSSNGVQQAQLGVLTALPFDVANCVLESTNATQTVLPNAVTQPFNMIVNVPTLTDQTGQGTPLNVSIGFGPSGAAPSTWTTWASATFVGDATVSDRYTGTLTAPSAPGASAVAFRVQVGARPFVYCDLDGSQNAFQATQAGRLTVATALIDSCQLGTVSSFSLPSGSPLTVTARATIPGVSANVGASPDLRVQIGVGPVGDNASTSGLWGWHDAAFTADVSGADEFSLTTFPAYTGGRAVSARASLDGLTWLYCDLNGSNVGGYEPGQQYDVTVTPHTEFDYCNTQAPPTTPPGGMVYGQIYDLGLTPNASTPFIAQVGVGLETADPGLAWSWRPAPFNVISANNNEYSTALTSVDAGQRYAFRYSLDAGVWCYGDFDGSQNGFSGGTNIGVITP